MKQPNVFWMTKDLKDQWGGDDIQGLFTQATGNQLVQLAFKSILHDDEDILVFCPRTMPTDAKTAEVLHDLFEIEISSNTQRQWALIAANIHWDNHQFWFRIPRCYCDEIATNKNMSCGLQIKLLAAIDNWVKKSDWLKIVELAAVTV
jgi:hypothetical protein